MLARSKLWAIFFLQKEREDYEVIIEDGKLMYKKSGELLDSTGDSSESKWIFVLSTSKNLYVGQVNFFILQSNMTLMIGELRLISILADCRRRKAYFSIPVFSLEELHQLLED